MILKHLLHMSNLHNVHIKFVSKIRDVYTTLLYMSLVKYACI